MARLVEKISPLLVAWGRFESVAWSWYSMDDIDLVKWDFCTNIVDDDDVGGEKQLLAPTGELGFWVGLEQRDREEGILLGGLQPVTQAPCPVAKPDRTIVRLLGIIGEDGAMRHLPLIAEDMLQKFPVER